MRIIANDKLPQEVQRACDLGYSLIPVGLDKRPLLRSWSEFQNKQATVDQLSKWQRDKRPPAWAMVTGVTSRVCVLDFDGEIGEATMHKLGINPHRRTGSGGFHWQFAHPGSGFRVPTLNAKTKRALGQSFPGTDVRGDGGYAVMWGRNSTGEYQNLRELSADPMEGLPPNLSRFILGVNQVSSEMLRRRAIDEVSGLGGRNAAGFWLAQQLRDNGYSEAEASPVMRLYAATVPETNAKGQREAYTEAEALASMDQAYRRSPRSAWAEGSPPPSRNSTTPRTPSHPNEPRYFAREGGMFYQRLRDGVPIPTQVTNFVATIVEDRMEDDGVEQNHVFVLNVVLSNRQPQMIEIPAKDFAGMTWVAERVGALAIVYPNFAQHARTAIQELSKATMRSSKTYRHIGWTQIDGELHYLHAGGAVNQSGNRAEIHTQVDATLPLYRLPDPPKDPGDRRASIRASLAVLDLAPDRLTFPVVAAVYRSILGPATFAIHINGVSGQGKSQLAALAQQHFGPGMDAEHLPASWQSSGGANVMLAFYAKDALLVVDDFVLTGSVVADQRLHLEAEKLLRAQGNLAGRRTLTTETRLRADKRPRGLIISTGEHCPRGISLNSRIVSLPFPKDVMSWSKLNESQAAAAKGELAKATACFIQAVAPRLKDLRKAMDEARLNRRQSNDATVAPHMRTPDNLESLRFGLQIFLTFARDEGAIGGEQYEALVKRATLAFLEVGNSELGKHNENDPARTFLRLLNTAFLMRRCHLSAPGGGSPGTENPWGWYEIPGRTEATKQPHGGTVGWFGGGSGDVVCLDPMAAFAVVSKLAHDQGESLPGTVETIKRDLCEQGFLHQSDIKTGRRIYTVRRKFEGQQREVLIISQEKFTNAATGNADTADIANIESYSDFLQEKKEGS